MEPHAPPAVDHVRATAAARKRPPPPFLTRHSQRLFMTALWGAAIAVCASIALYVFADATRVSLCVPAARARAPTEHRAFAAADASFSETYSALPIAPPKTWWQRLLTHRRRAPDDGYFNVGGLQGTQEDLLADGIDMAKGGHTRCSTTAFAVAVYLCGLPALHVLGNPDGVGVAALAESVAAAAAIAERRGTAPQVVWHVSVHDPTDTAFGHVFALHMLPDGRVQVWQSFVAQYTLQSHLKRSPPLDAVGVAALLAWLAILERATAWGAAERTAYDAAFGVLLTDKKAVGAVQVSFHVPCVVPPWNVTAAAADPLTPGHAADAAAFAKPWVAVLSVLTNAELDALQDGPLKSRAAGAAGGGFREPFDRESVGEALDPDGSDAAD